MRIFLNIIGGLVVLLVLVSMVVAVGGTFMDPDHHATVTAHIEAPPDSIFGAIVDVANYALWRKELKSIEILPSNDAIIRWREIDDMRHNWAFKATEIDTPSHVLISIDEPEAPVKGTWTFSILPEGSGSAVNVIEEGMVKNVLFRFIGRVFYSQTATMESYLKSLAGRFGQKVEFK